MRKSDFSVSEIYAIKNAIDFFDYELEDSTDRPSGWTLKRFCDVCARCAEIFSLPEDCALTDEDVVCISFVLRVFMETKELHGVPRSVPASFPEAVSARRKILSRLYT